MSDIQQQSKTGGSARGPLTYAVWGLALIGAAAALYVIVHLFIKPAGGGDLKFLARGDMAKLSFAAAGTPAPGSVFIDASDHPVRLSDLKGRILVVNLWATWCPPCVKEMPSLARLQAAYRGRILVAPISMDKEGDREKARAFIGRYPGLPFYEDEKLALPFAVSPPVEGFPTTVIYDPDGREIARLASEADWDSPTAHALFDALLRRR